MSGGLLVFHVCVSLVGQPLYERCDRLKPTLFRLASDTVDDDEALTQILAANDELTLVLNAYREQVSRRRRDSGAEGSSGGEQTQPPGKDVRDSFTCSLRAPWLRPLHLARSGLQPQLVPDR